MLHRDSGPKSGCFRGQPRFQEFYDILVFILECSKSDVGPRDLGNFRSLFPDPRGRMLRASKDDIQRFDRECQSRFQRKLVERSGKTEWWMNPEIKIEHN